MLVLIHNLDLKESGNGAAGACFLNVEKLTGSRFRSQETSEVTSSGMTGVDAVFQMTFHHRNSHISQDFSEGGLAHVTVRPRISVAVETQQREKMAGGFHGSTEP